MIVGATNALPPPLPVTNRRPPEQAPSAPDRNAGSVGAEEPGRSTEQTASDRGPLELTEAEQAQVRELQQRDREVRAHEMAHVAAGGRYVTKPASYEYQTGPDGRRYAVGGEVSIDTSVPSDPQEALTKAQIIERAALAPVEPSQQDYRVAAKARQMAADARREIAAERLEATRAPEQAGATENDNDNDGDRAVGVDLAQRATNLPLATPESVEPVSRFSLFA